MIIKALVKAREPRAHVGCSPAEARDATGEAEERSAEEGDLQEQLATEHLLEDLKGRTISSGLVTIVSQMAVLLLNLGSAVILARLLTPQDFGLVVMVTTVMSFFRIFKEAGLSIATVQREGITHAQVSNLFWANIAVSGAVSVIVAMMAPAIAWFYQEPRVIGITIALSGTFLLSGIAVQPIALLNRQMRFGANAVIQVGSLLAGAAVGVVMASFRGGYWSLVVMNITTPIVALFLTWTFCPWRPQLPRRNSGTRSLINFGAKLAAGEFIVCTARGADGLFVGHYCGAVAVGLYSRAGVLLARPIDLLVCSIGTVFTPALCRLQTEPERYRRAFLELYESVGLMCGLFTSLCAVLAYPLTVLVLGSRWGGASEIFAAFSIGAQFYVAATVCSWLFASQGRGNDAMRGFLIVSVLSVAVYCMGLPFGPMGVAVACAAAGLLIHMPILFYIGGKEGPVSSRDLWVGYARQLPVWTSVYGAARIARAMVEDKGAAMQVGVCTGVGVLVGVAVIFMMPASRALAFRLVALVREWRDGVLHHGQETPASVTRV